MEFTFLKPTPTLTFGLIVSSADNFRKQFRPRSGPTEFGSKVFDGIPERIFRKR